MNCNTRMASQINQLYSSRTTAFELFDGVHAGHCFLPLKHWLSKEMEGALNQHDGRHVNARAITLFSIYIVFHSNCLLPS